MKKSILLLVLAMISNLLYSQNIDYLYHLKETSGKAVTKADICIERGKTDDNGCFHINTRYNRAFLVKAEGYKSAKFNLKADVVHRVVLTSTSGVKSTTPIPKALKTNFEAPLYVVNGTYISSFKPSNYTDDVIANVTTTNKWNKVTRDVFSNSDIESIDVVRRGVVMIVTHENITFNTPKNKADYTIIVTDADGNPIKGASIYIRTVSTLANGDIKFRAKPNCNAIIVSNRYKDYPLVLSEESEADITLEKKPQQNKSSKKSQTIASFRSGDINMFRNWVLEYANDDLSKCREHNSTIVRAKFVVGSTGKVVAVEILEHNNSRAAKVVKRALYQSPKWSPAIQNGKAVKMSFVIPIRIPAL